MANQIDIDIYTLPPGQDPPRQEETLQRAIDVLRPQARYAILESLVDIRFPRPESTVISVAEWPKGRIFTPEFELRWEKNEIAYRVVLAKGKDLKLPGDIPDNLFQPDNSVSAAFWKQDEKDFYLWAENEARLGRTLHYECLDNERNSNQENVQLKTRLYLDARGRLIFWRYISMRWIS